jgi:hypothetical protein
MLYRRVGAAIASLLILVGGIGLLGTLLRTLSIPAAIVTLAIVAVTVGAIVWAGMSRGTTVSTPYW